MSGQGLIESPQAGRLAILVLYAASATVTNTVMEHLRSYANHSRHDVYYSSIHRFDPGSFPDLGTFDVVVLHYSFFPGLQWVMPEALELKLRSYAGLKILFAQDEYDHTEAVRGWIGKLGIRCVFTCVPAEYLDIVYPRQRLPGLEFRPTLTGYVPQRRARPGQLPLARRRLVIGYRGRALHPRYGHLGREKLVIAEVMKRICEERGIPADIECAEDKRIYGEAWYEFLGSCRATLGTESGSNVLDEDGALRARIDEALGAEPGLEYQAIHARYIGEREGRIRMNQASPRIFEAITTGTALIMFEGGYSGVVRPWDHYLPLRKDLANVAEILDRLADLAGLEAMTRRAYADVIASGRFGYAAFARDFDAYVDSRAEPRRAALRARRAVPVPREGRANALATAPCSLTRVPLEAQWAAAPAPEPPPAMRRAVQRVRSVVRSIKG